MTRRTSTNQVRAVDGRPKKKGKRRLQSTVWNELKKRGEEWRRSKHAEKNYSSFPSGNVSLLSKYVSSNAKPLSNYTYCT
jgi:hypothetical protein